MQSQHYCPVSFAAFIFVIFILNGGPSAGGKEASQPIHALSTTPNSEEQSLQEIGSPFNNDVTPKKTQKMARGLMAGGRQWKLNFADQSLRPETQQRIGYDLNLVFGHLPTFEIDTLPFPLAVDGGQLDRRVRFEGGTNRRPKVLVNSGFAHLEQGANQSDLFVPEAVTNAYLKAIELEKQNQAAYQQLDQFLERLSELKARPIENVRDLFVVGDDFKSAEADLDAMPAAGFVEGWGGKRYREPSILDVTSTAGTPLEKFGSLVATTYAMSSGKLNDLPPLVFSHGQWRFLLQRPPT